MYVIIAFITALLMISSGQAQEKPLPLEKIQPVAKEALASLGQLVSEKNFRGMGFESLAEVKSATLGEPLRVFMVRLDQLQKYEPGSDPNKLLSGGDRLIYPVMVGNQVRSSVSVSMVKDSWRAAGVGSPNLAKLLTRGVQNSAESAKMPVSSFFAVQIPALNLYFIAHRADQGLMLAPVLDDPVYGFKAGVALPADKVFETILPAAKKHNGLPG